MDFMEYGKSLEGRIQSLNVRRFNSPFRQEDKTGAGSLQNPRRQPPEIQRMKDESFLALVAAGPGRNAIPRRGDFFMVFF